MEVKDGGIMKLIASPTWENEEAYENADRKTHSNSRQPFSCQSHNLIGSHTRYHYQIKCQYEYHHSIVVFLLYIRHHPQVRRYSPYITNKLSKIVELPTSKGLACQSLLIYMHMLALLTQTHLHIIGVLCFSLVCYNTIENSPKMKTEIPIMIALASPPRSWAKALAKHPNPPPKMVPNPLLSPLLSVAPDQTKINQSYKYYKKQMIS